MLELDHVYTIEWPLVFRIKTGLEAQGFTGKMSSRDTCDMTTKQWSTATLNDGVAHVQKIAKQELEESESDLERQLEELQRQIDCCPDQDAVPPAKMPESSGSPRDISNQDTLEATPGEIAANLGLPENDIAIKLKTIVVEKFDPLVQYFKSGDGEADVKQAFRTIMEAAVETKDEKLLQHTLMAAEQVAAAQSSAAPVATPVRKRPEDETSGVAPPPSKCHRVESKEDPPTASSSLVAADPPKDSKVTIRVDSQESQMGNAEPHQPAGEGKPNPDESKAPSAPPAPKKNANKIGRQERLLLAAKATIRRMVAHHKRRVEFEAPEHVKSAWGNAQDRTYLAQVLRGDCNFNKAEFSCRVGTYVQTKKKHKVVIDEGWFTEGELSTELKWSKTRIEGALKKCRADPLLCRRNEYDGEEEFHVTIRERGSREQEKEWCKKETETKQKADGAVKIEDKEFSLVQAQEQRAMNAEQRRAEEAPTTNKFHQTKDSLSKCMKSMIDKSGKLRQLLRDINQNYSNDSAAKQTCGTIQSEITKIDAAYDSLNEAWTEGEVCGWETDKFYNLAEKRIRDGTFQLSRAAAAELKIRNAKKYWGKDETSGPKPKAKGKAKAQASESQQEPAGSANKNNRGGKKPVTKRIKKPKNAKA